MDGTHRTKYGVSRTDINLQAWLQRHIEREVIGSDVKHAAWNWEEAQVAGKEAEKRQRALVRALLSRAESPDAKTRREALAELKVQARLGALGKDLATARGLFLALTEDAYEKGRANAALGLGDLAQRGELGGDLAAARGRLLALTEDCLLYTSPSPRDQRGSRMPSSA